MNKQNGTGESTLTVRRGIHPLLILIIIVAGLTLTPARGQRGKPPVVVLVHGFCSDAMTAYANGNMLPQLLEAQGFRVYLANYGNKPCTDARCIERNPCLDCKDKSIEGLAARLANQIAAVRNRSGVSQVHVIAHSMGGLVTRAYVAGLAQYGEARAPYRGDINKMIFAGTPNYGTAPAALIDLLNLFEREQGNGACSLAQADQLELGSCFVWKMEKAWAAVTNPPDMLFIAGTAGFLINANLLQNNDGVANIYSVPLANTPDTRVRYVPYKHGTVVPFPRGTPALIRATDANHLTFRLTQAFLTTGTILPQCCGAGTVDYQPNAAALNQGMLVLRILDERGNPVLDASDNVRLSFQPSAAWDRLVTNAEGSSVTLVNARPPGNYDIAATVTGDDTPRKGSLAGVPISRARTTLRVFPTSPAGVGRKLRGRPATP